jgi:H2-forming N5,N10-methylenetetrahydromethanopterin dehydrogenase-like enzyme
MMKPSLGPKIFFIVAIFSTFGRYITNIRGTFVENVKKSKINPPYCTVCPTVVVYKF